VLTHCNAGALATAGYGTALGGFEPPSRQASKFTSSPMKPSLPPGIAPHRMGAYEGQHPRHTDRRQHGGSDDGAGQDSGGHRRRRPHCANGDTANKIGTYSVAIWPGNTAFRCTLPRHFPPSIWKPLMAREFPSSSGLPARSRTSAAGRCPAGVAVENPAFDVTPRATSAPSSPSAAWPRHRSTTPCGSLEKATRQPSRGFPKRCIRGASAALDFCSVCSCPW